MLEALGSVGGDRKWHRRGDNPVLDLVDRLTRRNADQKWSKPRLFGRGSFYRCSSLLATRWSVYCHVARFKRTNQAEFLAGTWVILSCIETKKPDAYDDAATILALGCGGRLTENRVESLCLPCRRRGIC